MFKNKLPLAIFTVSIFTILVIIILAGIVVWFAKKDNQTIVQDENESDNESPRRVINSDDYKFGEYKLEEIDFKPSVKQYTLNTDLSNVYYVKKDDPNGYYKAVLNSELTANQKTTLGKDWFIITEDDYQEFFSLYESNRYNYVPNFVTTDSLLHTYHLMFDSILKSLEEETLAPNAIILAKQMQEESIKQYEAAQNDVVKTAAKRNTAFFTVASKLMDDTTQIPDFVKTEVEQELAFIDTHTSIEISPVLSIGFEDKLLFEKVKEDYSQYVPRGHYTKSEPLEKYFKGMMYFGRITFLSKEKSTTVSALLMTDILKNNVEMSNLWDSIYAPTNFFVGKSDDLTFFEYSEVKKEFTDKPTLELTEEELNPIWEEIKKLAPPQINSMPIYDAELSPDRDQEITGFRFMGQRFTIDAQIFQNLIYRSIEEKPSKERKMLPTSLEIPMVMGDDTAEQILKADTDYYTYPNYESQVTKMKDYIKGLELSSWTQNIYWSWMYALNGFAGTTDAGYPQFMLTDKWEKKELNTYVSSWTELKHDTILYSKQAYAELGAGPGPENLPDDRGYVEPNIEVWRRLLALTQMTTQGLEDRGLISSANYTDSEFVRCSYTGESKERNYCNLKHMESTVKKLLDISKKELKEEKLTDDEYAFIRFIGGDLEDMFLSTLNPGSDRYTAVTDNPAMLVADVATDPNSGVLEEAIGYIYNIYVIAPVDGELTITKGAVYSQFEFKVPLDQRMTNEQWREKLKSNQEPEMLKWQKSLITN